MTKGDPPPQRIAARTDIFFTFPKRQILDSSILKVFADNNFKMDKNDKVFKKGIKHCGNMRNCSLRANSPFLAPLAEGQRAIVMALCPSCVCPVVWPSVCLCVRASVNFSFKKLLLRNY